MDEITAEYAVADLLPPAELKVLAHVSVGAKTDLGRVRENNEDKFEFYIPDDELILASRGQVFVVCDGMGGHAAGQIASELACKTFIDVYLSHPGSDPKEALSTAIHAANRWVFLTARSNVARKDMGTTLSALVLLQDKAYCIQVGDSRIYRLRAGELTQITQDHTFVNELVRAGTITPEEAINHPRKNVITRAVGVEEIVAPDFFEFDIVEGDTYFLCSDGVMNHVDDDNILQILSANGPAAAAWKIVGQALLGGGSDNTTAVVLKVNRLEIRD
jgi:serine/threonine protein phosphatase PrpC